MKLSRLATPFFVALLLATIPDASAQDIESGTWSGTLVDPGGQEIPVSFEVSTVSDSLSIDMSSPAFGNMKMPLSDITLSDASLTFSFQPGPVVNCELEKMANGSFEGVCDDASGEEGMITMKPPKDEN